MRELVDWRLAEYLDRPGVAGEETAQIVCKVSHVNGKPILFFPDRRKHPGIPEGWTTVLVEGTRYEANFVRNAINWMRRPGSERNELPDVIHRWFGDAAGQPGTAFQVAFKPASDGYQLQPLGQKAAGPGPVLWEPYLRAVIPALFGLHFSTSIWNSGFVSTHEKLFLLVTLDKENISQQFQYADRFLSRDVFEWQSQNRTRQESGTGKRIRDHAALTIEVHLFLRSRGRTPAGSGMPFRYCGQVDFIDWQGDAPITVQWHLRTPVPERLFEEFSISRS